MYSKLKKVTKKSEMGAELSKKPSGPKGKTYENTRKYDVRHSIIIYYRVATHLAPQTHG